MSLIVFPTDSYDSFCSVADADTLLGKNVPSTQRAAWDTPLSTSDKEIYLRQASLLIKQKITLPDTAEDDLTLATAYLANHSVGVNMLNEDGENNVKVDEVVGVVKTEYFSPSESSNAMPDIVLSLLSKYEPKSSGSFSFSRA